MQLCLSILNDELSIPSTLYCDDGDAFFSQFVLYHESMALKPDFLVVANAFDIPEEVEYMKGAAVLCIGEPSQKLKELRIPLLALPKDTVFYLIINELVGIFGKYNKLERDLDGAVLEGRGLQTLVNIMHPFIINELNLVDSNHRMIAKSFDKFRNLSQSGFDLDFEKEILPVEVINFFVSNKRWQEVRTEKEVFIYDEKVFANRLLCKNIITDTEFVCRIVIGETERDLRPYDEYLLNFFSRYVARVYERNLDLHEAKKKNSLSGVLQLVLAGQDVEPWRIHHGLSLMRYNKKSQFLAICIRQEYGDESGDTVEYYCEDIRNSFPGVTVLEYHKDIVCLVNTDFYSHSVNEFLKSFVPYIRDNNFRMGVSEHFTEVLSFRDYYMQAYIAVNMGLEHHPSLWVYRYYDYAVFYIAKQAGKEVALTALCSEKILKLYRYDLEHDSEYIRTISSYFGNGFNATVTAKHLCVHRTTLLYRLKRIEELANLTFDNTTKNLFYLLSIKILEFIEQ